MKAATNKISFTPLKFQEFSLILEVIGCFLMDKVVANIEDHYTAMFMYID